MIDPEIIRILLGIGKGIIYGSLAAVIGYLKNETWETVDPKKALKTVIIGAIIGGVVAYYGPLDQVWIDFGNEFDVSPILVETFVMTSLATIADQIVKVVWRRFKLDIVWQKIKDFFTGK